MTHTFRLGYSLAFRKPNFIEKQFHLEIDRAAFPEVAEKLKTGIGNEDLINEKIHSIEAGWRSHFFEERLRFSVDLFCNIYEDLIFFDAEAELDANGLPDIPNSTLNFVNEGGRTIAVGGEGEVSFSPTDVLSLWGNLGLRWVDDDRGERQDAEPLLTANLGCRWNPGPDGIIPGLVADLALHYVSSYQIPIMDPEDLFGTSYKMQLGNNLLAIGRLGYRLGKPEDHSLEAGVTLRVPLTNQFREYPGLPITSPSSYSVTNSDLGGEYIVRMASFYLRGEF
jgi:outer membrane receptor protein involved in Fe transport